MLRYTLAVSMFTAILLTLLPSAQAEPDTNWNALTGKNSPLKKGEVIAFFGDSITQAGRRPGGYVRLIDESIQAAHPELNVKIVYAGISGHKVPDLQKRLQRDVLSQKPTAVFIYIGINDVWHSTRGRGTPVDKFESGLRDLIKKISATGARIVLCTPSTIGEKTDGSNKLDKMLKQYATVSRRVAQETGVTLCDLRQAFLSHLKANNPENQAKGILTSDGVHLNAAGNKFVAKQAATSLASALRKAPAKQANQVGKTISLFNGKDLTGWRHDIPARDKKPELKSAFIVRDGMLVSLGRPAGHLITDAKFANYELNVEYRFAAKPGNCGVLVHTSTPRVLVGMYPKSIEVQMNHKHAGDLWCIGEDITVPDMEKRRGPKANWGVTIGKGRRILNLTDDSEKEVGQWNQMKIICTGNEVKVWVNGEMVNHGSKCTASSGQIAIQAEGAEVEFRKLALTPLK